jgi:hypothetical protein|tara:strand:+ start:307 stop:552 length:246 start_codon:yes stop_codon:yes gene_type:complete
VPVELAGQAPFPPVGELPYMLTLPAYVAHSFTFYFVLDALGLEPAILTWQSHEYHQMVLEIGLNLGVALSWIVLTMSLNRA